MQTIQVILTLLLTALFLRAQESPPSKPQNSGELRPRKQAIVEWETLSVEQAVNIDINGATIVGTMHPHDTKAIVALISRIKAIHPKVHRIETCWDELTVAAKVFAGDKIIYCAKDNSTEWHILRVIVRNNAR